MTLSSTEAEDFAQQWIQDWNSHDLDAILSHFEEDIVFTSPLAARVVPSSSGIVRGKQALKAYWAAAMDRIPALHFTLTGVCAGLDTIVILFRNERGEDRAEILRLRNGLAFEGHGTYAT